MQRHAQSMSIDSFLTTAQCGAAGPGRTPSVMSPSTNLYSSTPPLPIEQRCQTNPDTFGVAPISPRAPSSSCRGLLSSGFRSISSVCLSVVSVVRHTLRATGCHLRLAAAVPLDVHLSSFYHSTS